MKPYAKSSMTYPTNWAVYNDYKCSKAFHKYTHKIATGNTKIVIVVLHHKLPFILLNWFILYPFQDANSYSPFFINLFY